MDRIEHINAADYDRDRFSALKKGRSVYAVFSTCGEREAGLIGDKISLLRREMGDRLDAIILSHRRTEDHREEKTEAAARKAWSKTQIVLSHTVDVPDMDAERGKGADMRRALYWMDKNLHRGGDAVIVFLDADVTPDCFGAHFVLGLAGPVLEGYDFAKAGFHRSMGRVKKFVAQPLFSAVSHEKLRGLAEFSYPLSGEVAGTLDFFNSVSFWQMYGVETGINIDSCAGGCRIADVNLGRYDHEHHGDTAVQKMAFGVIRAYLIQLRDYGIIELKKGAEISDILTVSSIDRDGFRERTEFNLNEIKYKPLSTVLGAKRG